MSENGCAHCGRELPVEHLRDGERRYCSITCFCSNPIGQFCPRCKELSVGAEVKRQRLHDWLVRLELVAPKRCSDCNSVLVQKWLLPDWLFGYLAGRWLMIHDGGSYRLRNWHEG